MELVALLSISQNHFSQALVVSILRHLTCLFCNIGQDIRMDVASLAFSWETLAKRDLRRDGHGDGVKGVYLGELVNLASLEIHGLEP